jgi:hypothetical protein
VELNNSFVVEEQATTGEGRVVPSHHLDHINLPRALFGVCSKLHSF